MSCSTTITVFTGVTQLGQRAEQPRVIALVQSDRGLIEYVHDAGETRAHLARKSDALRLPRPERVSALRSKVRVVESHILSETAADPPRPSESAPRLRRASLKG